MKTSYNFSKNLIICNNQVYGTAGIPDIIACINGRFFGFETKTEDGKPTKLQEATIRKILAAGGTALVVRSVDEVRTAINGSLR